MILNWPEVHAVGAVIKDSECRHVKMTGVGQQPRFDLPPARWYDLVRWCEARAGQRQALADAMRPEHVHKASGTHGPTQDHVAPGAGQDHAKIVVGMQDTVELVYARSVD